MRLLHIITGLGTGGAEMMLLKQIRAMDDVKFSPVVISLMDGGSLRQEFINLGVEVYSLGMTRGIPSLLSIIRLGKIIKRVKPDVIQGWMYHGNFAAVLAKILSRKKVRCYWNIRQCIYDLSKEKRLTAWVIRVGKYLSYIPDKIVYNSKVSCMQHEGLGYLKEKSCVIPNGFDVNVFKPDLLERLKVRNELSVLEGELLIGIVGRFHPMKDHYNFLAAAKIVSEKYPNAFFLMAGRDICHDNSTLSQWLNDFDLMKKVFLLGERTDISSLNAAIDVFVLSSNSEAFPNVVGEAMACGTPCVVTDVGDAAHVVGDVAGYVVPASDADALAEGMIEILNLPIEERLSMGERARVRVTKLFSLDKVVRDYESLYGGEAK